ncbi:hypothetical protein ACWEQL_20115 [Kitasatospora sp. NPDC004240]
MTAQTITTMTGLSYSVEDVTGENGEVTYSVKRIAQEGLIPVGSFVIHPDYNPEPKMPALINIQFGAGSPENRHQRTDVPATGDADMPYVVGHRMVNPLDLAPESPIFLLADLAGAATGTGTSSMKPAPYTVFRTSELVTALVLHWMQRDDLAELTAKYAAFIKSETPWSQQYAEAKAAKVDKLTTKIMSIGERIDELTKQRDELPEGGVNNPDATPDMAPAMQMTGSINALKLKLNEVTKQLAKLKNS